MDGRFWKQMWACAVGCPSYWDGGLISSLQEATGDFGYQIKQTWPLISASLTEQERSPEQQKAEQICKRTAWAGRSADTLTFSRRWRRSSCPLCRHTVAAPRRLKEQFNQKSKRARPRHFHEGHKTFLEPHWIIGTDLTLHEPRIIRDTRHPAESRLQPQTSGQPRRAQNTLFQRLRPDTKLNSSTHYLICSVLYLSPGPVQYMVLIFPPFTRGFHSIFLYFSIYFHRIMCLFHVFCQFDSERL